MRKTITTGLMFVGLMLAWTDVVWAGKFLDNLLGRCVPRECATPCEPVCRVPAALPAKPVAKRAEKPLTLEVPVTFEIDSTEPPMDPSAEQSAPLASPEREAKPIPKPRSMPKLPGLMPVALSGAPAKPSAIEPREKTLGVRFDDPFSTSASDEQSLRIWTDATGTYRVEARLVDVAGTSVRLQRADGRFVRVEYARLSPADQRRVHDLPLEVVSR